MKLSSIKFWFLKRNTLLIMIIICFLDLFIMIKSDEDCKLNEDAIIPPEDLEEKIPLPDTNSTSIKSYKFLFMYKYHGVQNEADHKLNLFTYKNILLSNDQIVFFESPNENDPVNMFNYFYTFVVYFKKSIFILFSSFISS